MNPLHRLMYRLGLRLPIDPCADCGHPRSHHDYRIRNGSVETDGYGCDLDECDCHPWWEPEI